MVGLAFGAGILNKECSCYKPMFEIKVLLALSCHQSDFE